MDSDEIIKEVRMSYYNLLDYLIQKYGSAKYDYFTSEECKYKNKKVTRTKEGLYCHHMDEDEGGNLSNPSQAKIQPFAWQKKERLVYCNAIEHLILHMKINVLRQKKKLEVPLDIKDFFTTGGVFWITVTLNDMYMNNGTTTSWMKPCYENIKENYTDYISLIKSYFLYIEQNYIGDKSVAPFITVGQKIILHNSKVKIVKLSPFKNSLIIKTESGEEKEVGLFKEYSIFQNLTYKDYYDYELRQISSGYKEFYNHIYEDILNCKGNSEYCQYYKADYSPSSLISMKYGFADYIDIALNDSFGAHNADEYVSKALPMYCEKEINFKGKVPVFWSGKSIPEIVKKEGFDYFIRFRCRFRIKYGCKPFVQIKDNSLYNKVERLESSQLRYKGKYYDKLMIGDTVYTSDVILTMSQDDYAYFHENYIVERETILDGCYLTKLNNSLNKVSDI